MLGTALHPIMSPMDFGTRDIRSVESSIAFDEEEDERRWLRAEAVASRSAKQQHESNISPGLLLSMLFLLPTHFSMSEVLGCRFETGASEPAI